MMLPTDPAQAPPVVRTDLPGQLVSEPTLGRHCRTRTHSRHQGSKREDGTESGISNGSVSTQRLRRAACTFRRGSAKPPQIDEKGQTVKRTAQQDRSRDVRFPAHPRASGMAAFEGAAAAG